MRRPIMCSEKVLHYQLERNSRHDFSILYLSKLNFHSSNALGSIDELFKTGDSRSNSNRRIKTIQYRRESNNEACLGEKVIYPS